MLLFPPLKKPAKTGLNSIKLVTPTPEFWSWRSYKKSSFQTLKTTFST